MTLLSVVLGLTIWLRLPRYKAPEYEKMTPRVSGVTLSNRSVPLYGRLEITASVEAAVANPFDPADIEVNAVFTSPSGRTLQVPAFYFQGFTRKLVDDKEALEPSGAPTWIVRFTPMELGEYAVRLTVNDGGLEASSDIYGFEVAQSTNRGFLQLDKDDFRYLKFDNGEPAFLIGHNVCWYGSHGTYDYDAWFTKMAENGESLTRIWMAPWAFAIEWKKLGFYDQEEAWKLDYVIGLAEKLRIYAILCLINHGQFSTSVNPNWDENPYNARNSGPLSRPDEFWTNLDASRLFKNRLRYVVARWGYSPSILAWEFWNEAELTDNYNSVVAADWHREMGRYLRQIDPYGHLVSTSFANPSYDDAVWKLDAIDFTQIHSYGERDMVKEFPNMVKSRLGSFKKPVLLAEFASDWRWADSPDYLKDPDGVEVHDGIWATALSGSASTAMLWWWDNYVDPYGLYYHFKALSSFLQGISLPGLRPLNASWQAAHGDLRVLGLQNSTMALVWVKNGEHNWPNVVNNATIGEVADARLRIEGLAPGMYRVEWWNTYSGSVEKVEERLNEGALELSVERLSRDLALRVFLSSSMRGT